MTVRPDYDTVVSLLEKIARDTNRVRRSELRAVVTHWLQSQGENPPYCDDGVVPEWCGALTATTSIGTQAGPMRVDVCSPAMKWADTASIPFAPPPRARFTFADIFAGIGGFRLALQGLGGRCVFACEWDKMAKITYFRNFGIVPYGDIKQFTGGWVTDQELDRLIPYHDVLASGFPCQPFSLAGLPARNHYGIRAGFGGSHGDAFFDLVRIARVKRPRALFLENVRHVLSMDGGRTFSEIRRAIEQELGYEFHYRVIDSSTLVPQRRKRVYIVALRERDTGFEFPEFAGVALPLRTILEGRVPGRYTISDRLWVSHLLRSQRNRERGTGFTAKLASLDEPSPTIVARYGKDGKECLIPQGDENPRKLTPLECARLQGFPDSFIRADSDAACYRQFGNAVPVPVVGRIGESIVRALRRRTSSEFSVKGHQQIGSEAIAYFRKRVLRWGRRNFSDFPWRRSENLWHGLVAEIMLQRTRADQVLPVFMVFVSKYQKPEDFLASPTPQFSGLGLPIREEQFVTLNRTLVGEGLPRDKAALMRLPGVGDYVASAFLSLHLGKRAPLVDANTVRVYGRYFGLETGPETRRKRWLIELAEAITPARVFREYGYAVIDFSREVCTSRRPRHDVCPLKRGCHYVQTAVEPRY